MSVAALPLAGAIVAVGAATQGVVGTGFAMVAAPLLVLIDPALVPVSLIILAVVHATLAVAREGRHADWRGVGWLLLAGVASGAGATAAAIGGPPLALLYQHSTGPRVRATLAAVFVTGSAISLGALAIAGEVTTESLRDAALLLPFLIIGFLLSGPARRILDQGWTRTAVLAVAAASAVLLIVHSATGW